MCWSGVPGRNILMNVAIDASCLAINRFSGLSEVVNNLVINLKILNDGINLSLFLNHFRHYALQNTVCYTGINSRLLRLPRRAVKMWWRFNWPPIDFYLKGIDIFHSLHIDIPPAKNVRTVLTVHDCRFLALPRIYRPKDIHAYRSQMKRTLSRVDYVTTVSDFTRRELIRYFSFPEDRIRTIKNGFSFQTVRKQQPSPKLINFFRKHNLPSCYVIFIGGLDPRKNITRLIEAFALCRKKMGEFPDLMIVGISPQQWYRSGPARKAYELGVISNICNVGIVDNEILAVLTQNATALCYPSLYEGFGFPPLQAMSLGVPVLASNTSAIPEIVGDAACLVNCENLEEIVDGLNRIISDSEYRNYLIRLGYLQIRQFSWKKTVEKYAELYNEINCS
jgi:glycosyltransferase involved in cell wall biosynthesis